MAVFDKQTHIDGSWWRAYAQARLTMLRLDLWSFWLKLQRDWVLKLASMLAYQFIISLFPLLLLVLALYSKITPLLAHADAQDVQQGIMNVLPLGIGPAAFAAALLRLHHASNLLLVLGLGLSLLSGAHLFYTLQDCANIIFRLRSRNYFLKQLIAVGAMLLYCVGIPLAFALCAGPLRWLHLPGWVVTQPLLAHGIRFIGGWVLATLLFGLLYKIAPGGAIAWREVWVGAALASLLLIAYEQIFPFYVHTWLKPDNYGALAGFILIVLAFFYVLAFIILLGMEINSWLAGQRATAASLPTIIHEVQVNRTVRGAAGPTAGKATEDLRHHAASSGTTSTKKLPTRRARTQRHR